MNEFAIALVVAVVLAAVATIAAIRIYQTGWKAGFERASLVFDETLCFGCGRHICEACHDKVEMPFGKHPPGAHANGTLKEPDERGVVWQGNGPDSRRSPSGHP